MELDSSGWGGEGTFTVILLDALKGIEDIELLRIEDAPASRAEAGYAFISNEIYVKFRSDAQTNIMRRFGLPRRTRVEIKRMSLGDLAARLGLADGVGTPDYADGGLLQYLRTERIVPPYQSVGFKVVEMVRIYELEAARRS